MLTIRRCLNACIQNTGELNESRSSNKENASVRSPHWSVNGRCTQPLSIALSMLLIGRAVFFNKEMKRNKNAIELSVALYSSEVSILRLHWVATYAFTAVYCSEESNAVAVYQYVFQSITVYGSEVSVLEAQPTHSCSEQVLEDVLSVSDTDRKSVV